MPSRGAPEPGIQISLPRLTPVVKWILVALVCFAVVQQVWDGSKGVTRLFAHYAALFPDRVVHGQIWRLFTYPFVPGVGPDFDATSLILSGFMVYSFGTTLESLFGSRRFLLFVTACVVLGGIGAVIAGLFGSFYTQPTYGASPMTLALTAAWGARFPNVKLAFPPVSGKVVVWVIIALALLPAILRSQRYTPIVHLVSIGVGYLLAKKWDSIDNWLDARLSKRRRARKGGVSLRAIPGGLDSRKRPIDKKYLN